MADVGILNLQIHDDSSEAESSLTRLEGALRNIKEAAEGVKSISTVATALRRINDVINNFRTDGTIENLNGLASALRRVKDASNFSLPNLSGAGKIKQYMDSVTAGSAAMGDMKQSASDTAKTVEGAFSGVNDRASNATAEFEKFQESLAAADETMRNSSSQALKDTAADAEKASNSVNVLGNYIDRLMNRLNNPEKNRNKFSEIVNAVTGVTNNRKWDEKEVTGAFNKEFFENIDRVERFIDKLNHPASTDKWSSSVFEKLSSTVSDNENMISEMTTMFNAPAVDKDGPFTYASEEIENYRNLIAQATKDFEWWSREYDRIARQIKFNGATEERTNALKNAESSMQFNVDKIDEYEAALARVVEDTMSYKTAAEQAAQATKDAYGTGSIKGIYESEELGPMLAGLYGVRTQMAAIKEVSRGTGLSMEEIARQLNELSGGLINVDLSAKEAASNGAMETVRQEIEGVGTATDPTMSKIQMLQDKIAYMWAEVAKLEKLPKVDLLGNDNGVNNQINNYKLRIGQTYEQLQRLIEKANETQAKLQGVAAAASADTMQRDYGGEMVGNLVNNYSEIDLLTMKMDGMKQALADDINQNKVDTQQIAERTMAIQNLAAKIEELKNRQEEVTGSTVSMRGAWNGFRSGIQKMFPTLTGLLKRLKSIATMRALRYVIRSIAQGFSEGVQNVYHYSEAIGGTFATSMDSAASSLLQMKNSIGAALAPAIQALIPYLKQVISWFVSGINYVNQFFALLNGQSTWTKAVETETKAYEENTKAAKGASKAAKDLLADWDELNIIQSDSGSGSSGSTGKTATDYKSMFTEVSEYSEEIKALVEGIKEEFGDIWGLVKKIALIILGWKISTGFSGILGTLGSLLAALGIVDLEFHIVTIFDKNFLKTGDEGWLVGDILATLIGGVLVNKVLKKVLGGTAAKIAIPLTLAVSALAGITTLLGDTDTTALTPEALELSALTALKGGALAGYLFYSAGFTGGMSFGVGAAAALFFMGINVGLKAIADTVNTGEITKETIKANFLSAGLVAAGLMIGEAVLGGTIGTIVAAGGAGAILTLGALFAIEALLTLKEENPITWGDYDATKEEIESFVNAEIFSGAPQVKISLANATFDKLGEKKKALENSASEVLGTLYSVKLGLSTDAKTKLNQQVKELVKNFNETTDKQQDALQIAVSLVPLNSNDGKNGDTVVKNSASRLGELDSIMQTLATDLTKQFDIAYNEKLDEVTRNNAKQSVEKISKMMTEIADAISTGQAKAKIAHGINNQLNNLSQQTIDDTIEYYRVQREDLIAQLAKTNEDAAEGLLSQYYAYDKLAEYALKEAGGNVEDETYKHYLEQARQAKEDYDAMLENLQERAEKEADKTLNDMEGTQKLRNILLEKIEGLTPVDADVFANSLLGNDPDVFGSLIKGIIEGSREGDAKEELTNALDELLFDIVGAENFDTFKSALDSGILSYGDIFDKSMMDRVAEQIGLTETDGLKSKWEEVVKEVFKSDYKVNPTVDDSSFTSGCERIMQNAKATAEYVQSIMGGMSTGDYSAVTTIKMPTLRTAATGGFIRSGDLVMANENGQIEMMGKMGTQPVVANNQQIVSGISQGVATANGGVESRLGTIETLLNRILNKEFVAKAVPSSSWGKANSQSSAAYEKVTG